MSTPYTIQRTSDGQFLRGFGTDGLLWTADIQESIKASPGELFEMIAALRQNDGLDPASLKIVNA